MKNDQPAYKYIEDILRQRIKAAVLKPRDAVPSERKLAKIYRVSLMTARHALSELEHEGIVERRRGVGTFVAAPQVQFNRLMSYTEHMSSRGLSARSRVLGAEVMESEPQIAARLGLSAGEKIVRIKRLRLTAEERCALETCYLPAAKFSGLIKAPLERTSLFSILQHDYELELAYADEEIDAATADDAIARALGLSRGSPVLRIRQVIYSRAGSAAIYVVGFYRSEFHTLLVRRYR